MLEGMEPIRIGDVPLKCPKCGHECTFDESEPDADGDGSPGCPVSDCGGIMTALPHMTLLGPYISQ